MGSNGRNEVAQTVVFVCEHGAGKSRVAAALFTSAGPAGWLATSAGLAPQESASVEAARLLDGDAAGDLLDLAQPRRFDPAEADLVVGIDCDVPEARRWNLENPWPEVSVREELRSRVVDLAAELDARPRRP